MLLDQTVSKIHTDPKIIQLWYIILKYQVIILNSSRFHNKAFSVSVGSSKLCWSSNDTKVQIYLMDQVVEANEHFPINSARYTSLAFLVLRLSVKILLHSFLIVCTQLSRINQFSSPVIIPFEKNFDFTMFHLKFMEISWGLNGPQLFHINMVLYLNDWLQFSSMAISKIIYRHNAKQKLAL